MVPPHFDVTGAIGAAMLARDSTNGAGSRFKGFSIASRSWSQDRFTCKACPNQCEISRVKVSGEEKPLFYGGRCERYEVAERRNRGKDLPDLFEERTRLLLDGFPDRSSGDEDRAAARGPVIGLPRALSVFYQRFPFWRTFFNALGMRVVLSRPTDQALISRSLETIAAETCFPVEVMHGHVLDLLDKGVDGVFLPFVVNEEAGPGNPTQNCNCPWIQTYPFILKSALREGRDISKLLIPTLHFRYSRRLLNQELGRFMREKFGIAGAGCVPGSVERLRGRRRISSSGCATAERKSLRPCLRGRTAAVILGRPYNCGDPALNLRIVEKLINLDVLPIPADFLPLDEEAIFGRYPSMYWPNGRRILQACPYRGAGRAAAGHSPGELPLRPGLVHFSLRARRSSRASRTCSSRWTSTAPMRGS